MRMTAFDDAGTGIIPTRETRQEKYKQRCRALTSGEYIYSIRGMIRQGVRDAIISATVSFNSRSYG
jgi:hypothetical protein